MLKIRKRNPLLVPFLLAAVGLGVAAWYGEEWLALPKYSEADINRSVEINLAMDMKRLGPHFTQDPDKVERLRSQIHAEVVAEMEKPRREAERGLGAGLLCVVFAVGHAVLMGGVARPK